MSGADQAHDPHAATATHAAASDHTDHGEGSHGDSHDDHHGHGEPLGPIDVKAWVLTIVGIAAGLLVAAVLFVATTAPA